MEENRDPAVPSASSGAPAGIAAPPVPPAPPSGWPAPHSVQAASPPPPSGNPPRVGWFSTVARLIRLLLLRALAVATRAGRAVRPHVGWLAALGVLVGIIALQAFLLVAPRIFRSAAGDTRVALIAPPPAVLNFLEGQSTYNADLMWEAFSPEFQANLIQLGASKESIAAQVEDERLAGRRYGDVAYIGGIQLGDRSRYYYVVDIDSPQPDQAGSFSFIFTVNRDGKIVGVQRE